MRLSLLISLSLLLLSWRNAGAQLAPADDFFNSGAQSYISNNVPAALEKVETGLKYYPDDVKLKKLEQLLKQQQQSQSQQNQQQKNQQNQSQKQKSQSQQQKNQQQNQSSSQKNSESQQQQEKQKEAEQKKEEQQKQQQASAQKKESGKQDQQKAEGQPLKPGQMTPEEAKRLLDAQKGDEQVLQFKPQQKSRDDLNPVKDW
jgi:Ca-activated chloride channel family protein